MSIKTTYTARTKSQLVAALARKGFDRDAIRRAADNALRFGNWDVINFGDLTTAQNATVVITYGDTEVDLWDARLMTEDEHEAWTVAQHAARKANARRYARSIDHTPEVGEEIDGLGVVTWVSGRNAYDFGEDYCVIGYANEHGGTGNMGYIVTIQPEAEHEAAGPDHAAWCAGPSAHLPVIEKCSICLTSQRADKLTQHGREFVCAECSPADL